jgi:hypothetical protein
VKTTTIKGGVMRNDKLITCWSCGGGAGWVLRGRTVVHRPCGAVQP